MKKIICLVLIFTMMLTACSKWKVEIVDPTKPIENEQELAETEKETESELYIKSVSSEKIEAKNLSTDGFNNGLGSSLDFQLINNQKALFFTYKAEDPLAGIEVDIRVFPTIAEELERLLDCFLRAFLEHGFDVSLDYFFRCILESLLRHLCCALLKESIADRVK